MSGMPVRICDKGMVNQMNTILFPQDVDNVIQTFYMSNLGDDATTDLVIAIGAQLLGISDDEMFERINVEVIE